MPQSNFHPLTSSQIPGVVVVNCFAIVSTCALAWVAFRIAFLLLRRPFHKASDGRSPREYVFFHTQLGHYAACLLLGNLCSAVAGLIGFQWLSNKGITDDSLCTAQGVIMQIGNFTTAYFTIMLGVHTFITLVLRRRQSVIICSLFIAFGWIAAITIALSPLYYSRPLGPLYGTSGLSCGIRSVYPKDQFSFHLLPIFIASVTSAILYSLIFLVLRGTLVISGGIKLTFGPRVLLGRIHTLEEYHRFIAAIARSLLLYPIAYIALLVPYSVTRLLSLSGFFVPFGVIVLAFCCWFLLGLVNVLLLYNTFRVLEPAFDSRNNTKAQEESFSTAENFRSLGSKSPFGYSTQLSGEQIMAYRYPGRVTPSSTVTYENSQIDVPPRSYQPNQQPRSRSSMQSGTSSMMLLIPPTYKPNASSASNSPRPSLDRAISPASELNKEIVVSSEPAYQQKTLPNPPALLTYHPQGSADSLNSLPTPPRTNRSPISRRPTLESLSTSCDDVTADVNLIPTDITSHSMSRLSTPMQISRHGTFQASVPPVVTIQQQEIDDAPSPTDSEIESWLGKQRPDGSMLSATAPIDSPNKIMPLLSAVAPQSSFPSPTLSYYHQAPGSPMSVSSPRPLPPLPTGLSVQLASDQYRRNSAEASASVPRVAPVIGLPPVGKHKAIAQKPSMSAFGVHRPRSGSGHTRQSSLSSHIRGDSFSSGRYF